MAMLTKSAKGAKAAKAGRQAKATKPTKVVARSSKTVAKKAATRMNVKRKVLTTNRDDSDGGDGSDSEIRKVRSRTVKGNHEDENEPRKSLDSKTEKGRVVPAAVRKILGDRKLEDVLEENRESMKKAGSTLAECENVEKEASDQLTSSRSEVDAAQTTVEALIAKEIVSATFYWNSKAEVTACEDRLAAKRVALAEAQRKVALLEVEATKKRRQRDLEQQRREATAAAEAAKKLSSEQRAQQKSMIEAAKKQIAENKRKSPKREESKPADADAAADEAEELD